MEHSYELTAVYTDLFQLLDEQTMIRELTESEKNAFASALNEFAPHIQFTPFLQQLLQEILPEAKKSLGTCVCDLSFCDHQSDLFIYARILCDSEYQ